MQLASCYPGLSEAARSCCAAAKVSPLVSDLFRNHSMYRDLSRNMPVKVSSIPFCHYWSVSITSMPAIHPLPSANRLGHKLKAIIEILILRGFMLADHARRHFNHPTRANALSDAKGLTLANKLIDGGQALHLLIVGTSVMNEVICPNCIGKAWCFWAGPEDGNLLVLTLPRHQNPRAHQGL